MPNWKLEAKTGMRVNTVILDCEGCWVDLVSTYRDKFRSSVDKIILGKYFQLTRLNYISMNLSM